MSITREEAHDIAKDVVSICRKDVELELQKLREQDRENEWTEERAERLAELAADKAVTKITTQFYSSVGRKTVTTIGVTVVFLFVWFKEEVAKWVNGRR